MSLELTGLVKRFGSVTAVDGVDATVRPGQLHAIVGENGAGKSTVVNMVAGLLAPDAGSILFHGRRIDGRGRRVAATEGVGVVHQHPSLVDTMTVAENVELGRPQRSFLADLRTARAAIATWSQRTGFDVDPDATIGALSIGERQRAEIVSALAWGAEVLVLDEPTAVLSPFEADALLDVVTELVADGLAVVLVTHKLREVERYADEVTVLRSGKVVARAERGGFSKSSLVTAMVGEDRTDRRTAPARAATDVGDVRLELRGVMLGRLRHLDLSVRAGEIVGVAGVAGNGQRELIDVAAGLQRPTDGSVLVDGNDVTGRPADAVAAGVAVIPDDRDHDALALQLPVWANAVAKRRDDIGSWRGLDRAAIDRLTDAAIVRLGVRPARRDVAVGTLSGGNRQRLVIGRELVEGTSVVLAAEPTRGLDPPSTAAVLAALTDAAANGAAVLVVASDLDELLDVATRIVVLTAGEVHLDVNAAETDRTAIGAAMAAVGAMG
jgi:simple sugar transport system ATP-binding protein